MKKVLTNTEKLPKPYNFNPLFLFVYYFFSRGNCLVFALSSMSFFSSLWPACFLSAL